MLSLDNDSQELLHVLDATRSQAHKKRRQESFLPSVIEMGLSGLEPPTSRLSGVRSDQLSYRPAHKVEGDGFEPPNPKGADLQSAAFSHFATPP